jgi:hypothetical protein
MRIVPMNVSDAWIERAAELAPRHHLPTAELPSVRTGRVLDAIVQSETFQQTTAAWRYQTVWVRMALIGVVLFVNLAMAIFFVVGINSGRAARQTEVDQVVAESSRSKAWLGFYRDSLAQVPAIWHLIKRDDAPESVSDVRSAIQFAASRADTEMARPPR